MNSRGSIGTVSAFVFVLVLLGITSSAQTAIPRLINYQGVLRGAEGELVPDGNYSVTFRIWDDSTDGDVWWEEGRLVTVKGGLFNVLLGSVVTLADSVFEAPDRWLGIQVGLDPEMTPRSRLVSVPYAYQAGSADSAGVAATSLDKTTDAAELVTGTLDTARYSAYEDLVSEDRIGDQAGQVAAGEHGHAISSVEFIEDTVTVTVPFGGIEQTAKTITIPAGTVGGFFRVTISWTVSCGGSCDFDVKLNVNGAPLCTKASIDHAGRGHAWSITFMKGPTDFIGDRWAMLITSVGEPIALGGGSINESQPIVLSISAVSPNCATCVLNVGEFLVELSQ